ncbi:PPE family domain-containing protein [Tsukamurella strandjordii]|uniref:WXG100 family type VII secretion target n=1 Tax=Tsukamurella strandjordii TaxID=147577 RepID=UPI0039EE0F2A
MAEPVTPGPTAPGVELDPAIRALLDRPVNDVLAALGLPPVPVPPENPPQQELPQAPKGVPEAPQVPGFDVAGLVKPMTDLLSTFGSGSFSGLDPSKALDGASKALEQGMSAGMQAISSLSQVWQGPAATAATGKGMQAAAGTGMVAEQGAELSTAVGEAAAVVGQGEAELQAIIDSFMSVIAALGPSLWLPPGQVAAVTAAAEVASTVIPAVVSAATGAVSAVGKLATDTVSGAVQTATGLASSAAEAIGGMAENQAGKDETGLGTTGTDTTPTGTYPAGGLGGAGTGGASGGGGGAVGGFGGASAVNAALSPASPQASAPRTPVVEAGARTVPAGDVVTRGGLGGGMMPMAAAGARPTQGSDHNVPDYLVTGHNGEQVVGDLPLVGPQVVGDAESAGFDELPDVELRL